LASITNLFSFLPQNDDPFENLILPAVASTRHLLEAAQKTPTIKRLVVTSSALAIVYYETLLGRRTESTPAVLTSESRVRPLPTGPWNDIALTPAYAASKTLALDLLDKAAASRPGFDIINILPGVVVGPSGLYTSTAAMTAPGFGSNSLMLNLALGRRMEGTPFPLGLVGITDVARIHVAALDATNVPGPTATFILDAERSSYDEIKEIVKKHFPEKVADGTFSENGTWTMVDLKMDTSNTVQTFGRLDSYESDVVKLIEQYLELKAKEAK
jgi:nucleoside-diphosphate-sugar epimerase